MTSTQSRLPEKLQAPDMPRDTASSPMSEATASPQSTGSSTSPDVSSGSPSSPSGAPSGAPSPTGSSASPLGLLEALRAELEPLGFECHPLLVGWYNSHVPAGFQLPHPPGTLAVLVISTPDMFEKCFIPHVRRAGHELTAGARRDPLDTCMRHVIGGAAAHVHAPARVLYDFDLSPTRRPRVLVQTAGHVSGAVRLYRREELKEDPWPEKSGMMGVCLHPRLGGWFALRAVVILDGVEAPDLPQPQPPEILTSEEEKRSVLELFNWHWRDGKYREFGAQQCYSPLQREYFLTPPGERGPLVERIIRGEVPTEEESEVDVGKKMEEGKEE